MNCSHCKKSMLKGQTAYQKKGFSDVFCSKNCLFELFPINKPATKTCYYCLKWVCGKQQVKVVSRVVVCERFESLCSVRAISQPLDLIMAAVDVKGTMKDFCSPTCLVSFKSNTASTKTPSQLCSKCNKSCTVSKKTYFPSTTLWTLCRTDCSFYLSQATCELNVNKTVYSFCSIPCLEDFRRGNTDVCDNCSSNCIKPLTLELQDETIIVCGQECLDDFKEVQKHAWIMQHFTKYRSKIIA